MVSSIYLLFFLAILHGKFLISNIRVTFVKRHRLIYIHGKIGLIDGNRRPAAKSPPNKL